MGIRQVFPLDQVSPWSTDPFNDAVKDIASATGDPIAKIIANAALIWYSDPFPGSGRWAWSVRYNFEPEAGIERDLYTVGSGGNASISIGAITTAPTPIFTANPFVAANVFQKMSPPASSGGTSNTLNPGIKAGCSRPVIRADSPTVLQDIYDSVYVDEGGTPQSWEYFYDKRTGSEMVNGVLTPMGTGIWLARGTGWMAYGQANIFCIAQVMACAVQAAGGAPAIQPPASWTYGSAVFKQETGLIII